MNVPKTVRKENLLLGGEITLSKCKNDCQRCKCRLQNFLPGKRVHSLYYKNKLTKYGIKCPPYYSSNEPCRDQRSVAYITTQGLKSTRHINSSISNYQF